MSIDPNKLITINDCRGTCKTPIGCTCGTNKVETVNIKLDQETLSQKTNEITLTVEPKMCTCGKKTGEICGCSAKGANGNGCGCPKRGPAGGCCGGVDKLEVYDWMADMPDLLDDEPMVEVQFKNTRKDYYLNSTNIDLKKGDMVAVEASPGHDIGKVVLTGKLVKNQMRKNNFRGETKRVYRIARPTDLEKYEEAKSKEHATMLRARILAEELELEMKISDVEYQGDGNKAIFYYIADGRVDFRQLIRVYASEFRLRIEMRQIGARQEAGRVGGIGSCGRELCCASSMSSFVSVSTTAARLQDIPLNPQKLAGQCGKLKCCLNFEVDTYVEARKKLPSTEVTLETQDITYHHFKTDVLSGQMTYSVEKRFPSNLVTLDKERVVEIIHMNRRGEKPFNLLDLDAAAIEDANATHDILDQDINRFDNEEGDRRRGGGGSGGRNRNRRRNNNQPGGANENRNRRRRPRNQKEGEQTGVKSEATQNPNQQTRPNRGNAEAGDGANRPQNRRNNRNNRARNRGNRPSNQKPDA